MFYSKLVGNLLAKLLNPPYQYKINCVSDYYKKLAISSNLKLESLTEDWDHKK